MRFINTFLFGIILTNLLLSQSLSDNRIWNETISFLKEEDYLRTIENMDQYLERYPDNPGAYYNRGYAKLHMGDFDGACKDFQKCMSYGKNKKLKIFNYFCNDSLMLKLLQKNFYKGEALLAENGFRPEYTRKDTLRGKLRPERTCFDVVFYNLTVRLNFYLKSIAGTSKIWFRQVNDANLIQIDLFKNMEIDSVTWQGKSLNYTREYDAVWIHFPELLKKDTLYSITISYHGEPMKAPNPPWDGGFVWSRNKRLNRWVGVSCEQLGASVWWPNKDHLSDKPDSMLINIEVPDRFQVVSNGNLRAVEEINKKYTRYSWFVSYPINNYNATFYVGKYTSFNHRIITGIDTLFCKYYVMPYNIDKARLYFQQVDSVVKIYNEVFGYFPFPRDKYKLVESPYSGMEHQTAIAFGNEYEKATQNFTIGEKTFDYLIVHETAHEWWGNAVTVGDMTDAWIHEGFATYAELIFTEKISGYNEYLKQLRERMFEIFNFWPMVENRDVNEDAFASNDIYTKGATMIHCFRCALNDDSLFYEIIHDFNIENRYKVVSTDDFIRFVNIKTKQDYSAFFKKYLYDRKLPVLNYSYERQDGNILLKYCWTGVEDGFFMPFSVEYGEGQVLRVGATTQQKEVILEDAETFAFFNRYKNPDNCPYNGYTYFWTKMSDN